MRLVFNNATFNTYGFRDSDPIVARIAENYGGIGNRIDLVRRFIDALGADGTNDIWSKIQYLYMPVLAVPEDGIKAMYEIIWGGFYSGSYVIEANRGVGPTTLGQSIGYSTLPSGFIDDDSLSGFCVFTQSSRQTLTGSSGGVTNFCGLETTWRSSYIEFGGSSAANRVDISTGFTKPQAIVFSKKVNSERTVIGRENETTITTAKSTDNIYINGSTSWADTSIFALCKNLTPAEAAVVAAALDDFIDDFGIECVNV